MPIVGKDIVRKIETTPKTMEIKLVPKKEIKLVPAKPVKEVEEKVTLIPAYLIHPNRLINPEYCKEVMESSKRDGIIYSLIVRPCTCNLLNVPHYEIVDGHSRHAGKDVSESVRCVVYDLTDEQALLKMYLTDIKGAKSAYWKSQVIAKLVELKEKELKEKGIDKGAKTEVARMINKENIESGQVLVSQYLKIFELFQHLETSKIITNEDLMRIKCLDKDSLLALANTHRDLIPQVLEAWKKNPNLTIQDAKRELIGYRPHYPSSKPKRSGKEKAIEFEPPAFTLSITPDLLQRIRVIKSWIMEILEDHVKGTGIHWSRRNKILQKFIEKSEHTTLQIAKDCLVMGIEDVEQAFREGSINIVFETVEDVPIGYRTMFKKRKQTT